jgi:two-component system nitrogen regulation sensor histidine kinase NtrY
VAFLARRFNWETLARMRHLRRYQNAATLGFVGLGPVLVAATFVILGPLASAGSSPALRLILLADLVYVLAVAALILIRVARMIAARRARSAGSQLHLRLTVVFVGIALVPTIMVAVFAGLTINIGLEGWFSERVRNVISNSLSAAQAYEAEHRTDLSDDTVILAGYLNTARTIRYMTFDGDLRQILTQGQTQIQRGLHEAYVINSDGDIRVRGERSYLFDFERPEPELIITAGSTDPIIIEDWDNNEFRALIKLEAYPDHYLYVSRIVDGEILKLLDETRETVGLYQQLENDRGRLVFEFGLLYLGFAVILLLGSIWVGLLFAERLSRPVGRLAGAAQRVGSGDLSVRVVEEEGDDEIATLGRIFNKMTRQLKGQRDDLLETNAQIDARRRLFDSVLSSVTAGVIGLDPDGHVTFMNRSALRLLGIEEGVEIQSGFIRSNPETRTGNSGDHALGHVVPEFAGLLERMRSGERDVAQEEVRLTRDGTLESLLVRMARRQTEEGGLEGYVVAFDDVTELVSAQRMAAWGDVARRIAHEIKNPLTPIRLSAERLQRKFASKLGDDGAALIQMTDVIIRQTNDLRRIVDEFSKFARMPEPERRECDLTRLVRDAVVLQSQTLGAALRADLPDHPVLIELDSTMIGQALTNLIKNAGEAIESLQESDETPEEYLPRVDVTLTGGDGHAIITISDNGIGLPADKSRLFEPYVTTRAKGTGLGLAIVKKIIEEHGGTLELKDAPVFDGNIHRGALARIVLPQAVRLPQAAE